MAENIPNPNHHYFFRATMLDVATFTVGIPELSGTAEDDVWQTIRSYAKDNDRLGLPDPYDLFEFSKHVGMVSWPEARVYQRTKYCWPRVAMACVSLDQIYDTMPPPIYVPGLRLAYARDMQEVIDFPLPPKTDTI